MRVTGALTKSLGDIDTSGTFAFAVDIGRASGGTDRTIGDATFKAENDLGAYGISFTNFTANTQTGNTGDADWDAIFGVRRYRGAAGNPASITLSGLTTSQDYKLQVLLYRNESGTKLGSAGHIDLDQTAGEDVVGYVEEDEQLVVWAVAFTAGGATATLDVTPTTWNTDLVQETLDTSGNNLYEIGTSNPATGNDGARGDRLEGLVAVTLEIVQEPAVIPEPVSAFAVLLGAGALGRYARRRRS